MVLSAALTLAIAPALNGVAVHAQIDRANLNGTVIDSTVVANARVEVMSRETGLKRAVETGPTGTYSITGLPIGTYDPTISRSGFRNFDVTGIQLFVGQTRTIDAELQVGAAAEDVQGRRRSRRSRRPTRGSAPCSNISNSATFRSMGATGPRSRCSR